MREQILSGRIPVSERTAVRSGEPSMQDRLNSAEIQRAREVLGLTDANFAPETVLSKYMVMEPDKVILMESLVTGKKPEIANFSEQRSEHMVRSLCVVFGVEDVLGLMRVQLAWVLIPEDIRKAALDAFSRAGKKKSDREIEIQNRVSRLSNREREVLQLLAQGMTSKGVAREMGLSDKTIENHRARILGKLEVTNTVAALKIAYTTGLLGNNEGDY